MTVSVTSISSGPFAPNGVQTVFPFTFQAAGATELRVYRLDDDNVETDVAGWTATLNPDRTGSVVFETAPAVGDPLYLEAAPSLTQSIDIGNQGAFLAQSVEDGFDRAALVSIYLYNKMASGGGGGGGGGGVTSWASILDKPSTFTPSAHTHAIFEVTGLTTALGLKADASALTWANIAGKPTTFEPTPESVEDIIGSKVVAGANITVTYNDIAGTTTIASSGTVSADWADITSKPSTFTPTTENVQDIVAAQITAGTNVTTSYDDTTGALTINSTASGSVSAVTPLETYGSVTRDGTTDNQATLTAAKSAGAKELWQGGDGSDVIYADEPWTSYTDMNFRNGAKFKFRWGAGSGEYDTFPPNFVVIASPPTQSSDVNRPYDGADLSYVNTSYFRLRDGVARRSWSSTYYDPTVSPNWIDMQTEWKAGDSGTTSWVTTAFSGTTLAIHVLNTTDASLVTDEQKTGFAAGDTIKFFHPTTDVVLHTTTVSSVSGSTLTIATAPAATVPVGARIAHSLRTMNTATYTIHNAAAGGDNYINMGRMFLYYKAKSGQRHVFQTATAALYGGELHALSEGLWLTALEINQVNDNGFDVGASIPLNFHRTNNAGKRFAYWNGIAFSNADIDGRTAVPMDNWLSFNGPAKVGIDMGLSVCTFTEAAIGTKIGMDWHMDRAVVSRVEDGFTNPYPEGYSTNSYDPSRSGVTSLGFHPTDGRGVRIRMKVNGNELVNFRATSIESRYTVRAFGASGTGAYAGIDASSGVGALTIHDGTDGHVQYTRNGSAAVITAGGGGGNPIASFDDGGITFNRGLILGVASYIDLRSTGTKRIIFGNNAIIEFNGVNIRATSDGSTWNTLA